MRAFLTIIKDSFHETLVSKTLWVLLVMATVFLVAIALLSIEDRGPKRFASSHFRNQDGLIREINRQAKAEADSPGKRIARIDAEKFVGFDAAGDKSFPRTGNLAQSLDEVTRSRDLYAAEAWRDYTLGEETQRLLDRGMDDLSEDERVRFNRLLLEAAYRPYLNPTATSAYLGYAGWKFDEPLPTHSSTILARALTIFADYILGVFGVFIAILVTSSFVPRTFETGAIDLLLSKPVSRSMVFLAKFVGGCAFVFVISSYLIGGLYLIAGLRWDYWNHRFLWCVPVLLFLFAIYYSVSAMAGVLWRNAIVCVVVSMVFWALCFGLGVGKSIFEAQLMYSQKIYELTEADGELFAAFRGDWGAPFGKFRRWDGETRAWTDTMTRGAATDSFAMPWENRYDAMPTYDFASKRLLAVGNSRDSKSGTVNGPWLFASSAESKWREETLGRLPRNVRQLIVRGDGKMLGLSSDGIIEIPTNAKPLAATQVNDEDATKALECADFDAPDWSQPLAAVAVGGTIDLVTYDAGLVRLRRLVDGKRYEVHATYEVTPEAATSPHAIDATEDRVVLGLSDGRILVLAVKDKSLALVAEHLPENKSSIREVRLTPDGKSFAVRGEDECVFWYETDSADVAGKPLGTSAQGDITAIAMSPDGKLSAAYAFNHVVTLDAGQENAIYLTPSYSGAVAVYWYFLKPLYTIFPKPGELGNLTAYLLHGKETINVNSGHEDGNIDEKLDIYTPIWSNLLFLSVMLSIGCWYVSRRDF